MLSLVCKLLLLDCPRFPNMKRGYLVCKYTNTGADKSTLQGSLDFITDVLKKQKPDLL